MEKIQNKKIAFAFYAFFCCLFFTGCFIIPVTTQGYIDSTGKMVIKPKFYYAVEFHEGVAQVGENDNQAIRYIDTTGKYISNMIFSNYSENFSEGLALAHTNGEGNSLPVFIDKSGQIVLISSGVNHGFKEGLSSIMKKDLHLTCFVNKQWETVIKTKYYTLKSFSEGMCAVEAWKAGPIPPSERRFGYIDKTGKLVIGLKYKYADDFSGGLAKVQVIKTNKMGFINKKGQMIIEPKFGVCHKICVNGHNLRYTKCAKYIKEDGLWRLMTSCWTSS